MDGRDPRRQTERMDTLQTKEAQLRTDARIGWALAHDSHLFDGGAVRDILALGITIIPTAAAAELMIAMDAPGLVIQDGGIAVDVARYADVTLTDDGSPGTRISLWQRNAVGIKAERMLRFGTRAGAVAWAATTGGTP
jgi:hypothetical protein